MDDILYWVQEYSNMNKPSKSERAEAENKEYSNVTFSKNMILGKHLVQCKEDKSQDL